MGKMMARLNGFYCYRHLLKQLVQKDIKLKYRRSFLGVFVECFKSTFDYGYYGCRFFKYF